MKTPLGLIVLFTALLSPAQTATRAPATANPTDGDRPLTSAPVSTNRATAATSPPNYTSPPRSASGPVPNRGNKPAGLEQWAVPCLALLSTIFSAAVLWRCRNLNSKLARIESVRIAADEIQSKLHSVQDQTHRIEQDINLAKEVLKSPGSSKGDLAELREYIGKKTQVLLTENRFGTAIEGLKLSLSRQDKAVDPASAGFSNLKWQLEHLSGKMTVLEQSVFSIKGQLQQTDAVLQGMSSATQQLNTSASGLEKAKAALESLSKDVDQATKETAGERAAVEKLTALAQQAQADARETAAAERREAEACLAEAKSIRADTERKHHELGDREKGLSQRETEIASKSQELEQDTLRQQALLADNQKALAELKRVKIETEEERQAAANERHVAQSERERAEAKLREAERFTDAFWPDAFQPAGPLFQSRQEIQQRFSGDGCPEAGLLLAALFRFHLVASAAPASEWPGPLGEMSRCAYRYWKACGLTPDQRDERAKQWAVAFNTRVAPNYGIKVASPGLPKEPTWMSYKPGSPPRVTEAETWAVLNAKNIAVVQADVV